MGNSKSSSLPIEIPERDQDLYDEFKLLDLPDLPLIRVLQFMTPVQLWTTVYSSPRCKILAKDIDINATVSSLKVNGTSIGVYYAGSRKCETLTIDSENQLSENELGWRRYLRKFVFFMDHPITSLAIETDNFLESWKWINSDSNENLEKLELTVTTGDPEKVLNSILTNSELCQLSDFNFEMKTSSDFKYDGPFTFVHPPSTLSLRESSWINLINVAISGVKHIYLLKSKVSDRGLNNFLKCWMTEEYYEEASLETLRIEREGGENIDINVVFEEVDNRIEYCRQFPTGISFKVLADTFGVYIHVDKNVIIFSPYHGEIESDV